MAALPKYEDVIARQPYYNPSYVGNSAGTFYGATPQQPQQVIIVGTPSEILRNHNPVRRHPRDYGNADPKFSCTRGFQCMLAIVALGLQCGLLSYDSHYWYYWLWLLVIPLGTIFMTIRSGCSEIRTSPGQDAGYAFLWMLQVAGVVGVYYGYYIIRVPLADLIVVFTLITCGAMSLTHWIMACCCRSR